MPSRQLIINTKGLSDLSSTTTYAHAHAYTHMLELDINEALERVPMGLFQYRILFMCGLAFMADALEVNLLTFLSICAASHWNLSDTQQASITGVVFAGVIVGSILWGVIADKYGRKYTFVLISAVITVGGFLTGFAPNFAALLAIRSVVGFGLGGGSVPFDLLAEFMPAKVRGRFLVYIEYFWTIGSLFVTSLAWLFLDAYGWKVLSILTAIPVAVASLMSVVFLPESPRWLLSQGRGEEAAQIIRDSARVNGCTLPEFTLLGSFTHVEEFSLVDYTRMLSDPALRRSFVPLSLIWTIFGFTYYGVILFVGRMYTKHDDDDNNNNEETCSFDYSSMFVNALAELGGVTLSALALGMGRVRTQSVFYALSAVSVFLMGLLSPWKGAVLAMSIFARMAVMAASNVTWVSTPELLPTKLRSFGHAVCLACSKLGAFSAPYLVVSQCSVLVVGAVLGVANACASVFSLSLRETAGQDLDDVREREESEEDEEFRNPLQGYVPVSDG